jgi:hypothetical protein
VFVVKEQREEADQLAWKILERLEDAGRWKQGEIGEAWEEIVNDPNRLAVVVKPDYLQLFATRLRRIVGEAKGESTEDTERGVKICAMHAAAASFAPKIEYAAIASAAVTKVHFGNELMTGNNELTAGVILFINAALKKARKTESGAL